MKFLVDAQLPRRMARRLQSLGHDTVHTLDLPNGNRSKDSELIDFAQREQRVLITKDSDFLNSFVLSGTPGRLLLVSTGNISNKELYDLLVPLVESIVTEFQTHNFLELTRTGFIVHE